jgi:deoxyribonuclease V
MARKRALEDIWPKDTARAKEIQLFLAWKVKVGPLKKNPNFIAAVDASFLGDTVMAAASLYKYPEMTHLEDAFFRGKTRFPYIPGYLSFREGRAVINAIKKLKIMPDLLFVDGQGIAHPRGIGIASHIGVILNLPTIGCAKSRLIGEFRQPGREKGQWTYLYLKGEPLRPIGAVLRTRTNVRPLFVSPGHLTDIESSVAIIMQCTNTYRIPEPLRRADMLSRMMKREQA